MAPQPRKYVIGVVRHPVDRLVSAWRRKHYSTEFGAWLRGEQMYVSGVDFLRCPQRTWLYHCDRVLHFESLADEWEQLAEDMGWPSVALPHENTAVSDPPRLLAEDVALIHDRFSHDFSSYGYRL